MLYLASGVVVSRAACWAACQLFFAASLPTLSLPRHSSLCNAAAIPLHFLSSPVCLPLRATVRGTVPLCTLYWLGVPGAVHALAFDIPLSVAVNGAALRLTW